MAANKATPAQRAAARARTQEAREYMKFKLGPTPAEKAAALLREAKRLNEKAELVRSGRLRRATAKEAELLRRRLGYRLRPDGTLERISPLKSKREKRLGGDVSADQRAITREVHEV